jgi:probable aminopeptidase NPEPL1
MIQFHSSLASFTKAAEVWLYLAPQEHFRKGKHTKILPGPHWRTLLPSLKEASSGARGKAYSTFTGLDAPTQLVAVVLPDTVSRSNTPTRKEFIYAQTAAIESNAQPGVILVLDDEAHFPAAVAAVARRIRPYYKKSSGKKTKAIHVLAFVGDKVLKASKKEHAMATATEWACRMVDTPPTELDPHEFARAIKAAAKGLDHVTVKEIAGDQLLVEKLGGIHAVGRAASAAPRMLILDYKPPKAKKTIALIGKGVTYDTGGLNLKISGAMCGMKSDMGGAATMVGALTVAAKTGAKHRIVACVGLVENAIGPTAYKPDDVITMHSGKTVEINNTDAEGRLVLADCVSYAARRFKPDLIIEAATLTGAQMVATGSLHAGLITNRDELDTWVVAAGKDTGDLVAPLPFAPELFQDEFQSQIADMKNSVKNRANAQSSCAAQFVYAHIDDLNIPWVHIDMAGPSVCGQNLATGYGIGLVAALAHED